MDDDFLTDEQSPSLSDGGDSAKGLYNTVRPSVPHRATQTFRARLTFFFALTAAMTAVILSLVLAFTWEGQFQTYTRTNMQRLADSTADVLATQYEQQEGWTRRVLTYAKSASTASNDLGVQVLDEDNEVIYDDTWALSRRSGYTGPTPLTDADLDDDSLVVADVITSEGDKVGTVRLWAFGSDALLTKSDAAFRQHSYQAIFGAAGIAVLLACVIGYFTSRKLTRPIKVITSTAAQIRSGDLTARTNLRGEDEIGQLGETFDSMATTLEHDIKIEHRLTSDVAHELRTPLMAMLVTVEAMQDGVMPADYNAARKLVRAAAEFDGPVYLRFTRDAVPEIYDENEEFKIGKGKLLRRGKDVAIIANGDTVRLALQAAEALAAEGIEARVVDMHTIKPLDTDCVMACIDEIGKIVTVEDHNILNGLGSAVCELAAEAGKGKVKRIGIQDQFGQSAPYERLLEMNGVTVENIVSAAKAL